MSLQSFLAKLETMGMRGVTKITPSELMKLEELAGKIAAIGPDNAPSAYKSIGRAYTKIMSELPEGMSRGEAHALFLREMRNSGVFGDATVAMQNEKAFRKFLSQSTEIAERQAPQNVRQVSVPAPSSTSLADAATRLRIRGTALDEIELSIASQDPKKIEEAFKSLRGLSARDPDIIAENLRVTRNLSAEEVVSELRAGKKVSRKELLDTQSHFVSSAQEAGKIAALADKKEALGLIFSNLSVNRVANFKMETVKFFEEVKAIIGENGLKLIDSNVARIKLLSPKEIFQELREGRKVSPQEIENLEVYYRRHFDKTVSQNELAERQAKQTLPGGMGMFGAGVGGGGTINKGLQIANGALQYLSNNVSSGASRNLSRNVIWEWENVGQPGLLTRYGNNLKDGNKIAVSATAGLALFTAFEANYLNVRTFSEGVSPGLSNFFFSLQFDRDNGTIFEKKPEIINRQFDVLTKYPETSQRKFAEYASIITGLTLPTSGNLDRETLFQIATILQENPRGVLDPEKNKNSARLKKLSPEHDIPAFIYALASYSGVDVNEFESLSANDKGDGQGLINALVERNNSGSTKAFMNKFIGTSVGNTPEFVEATKRITGGIVDISAYKGSGASVPAETLLNIAIALQSSTTATNPREFDGYLLAFQRKIGGKSSADPEKLDDKTRETLRKEVLDKALDLYTTVLSVSNKGESGAFFNKILGGSTPSSNEERDRALYTKLQDQTFRSTKDGMVLTKLLFGEKAKDLIGKDNEAIYAFLEKQKQGISQISLSSQAASIAQGNLAAGAARAAELTAEALRNDRDEERRRGAGGLVSQMRDNGQGITRKVESATFERSLSELTGNDSPYSPFKGQSDKLRSIFNSSRTPDNFDQELRRVFPGVTPNAITAARELAYQ